MTEKSGQLKEAIEVLKEIQGNDNRTILEVDRVVIDTVLQQLEKPLPTDKELKEQ